MEMEHLNSALARRGGRVVGTDRRSLSFVHQVPSNGEEYEKDSDDDPNFDAGHNEVTPVASAIAPQVSTNSAGEECPHWDRAREYRFTPPGAC